VTVDEAFWVDERKIEDMSFGAELTPKLADVMKDHPWPESAFIYMPPVFTYLRPENKPADFDFARDEAEKQAAFEAWASVPDNIEAHRAAQLADWKKRMAEIPTEEARTSWARIHEMQIERVRDALRVCRVKIADDIKRLGCTGATHYGLSLDDIKFLRMGLAGGGVGLPCFVPPTRYCLAHETTGGLQEGQTPGYANVVESISRELTPEEAAHSKLVTEAQWSETQRGAFEKLRGRKLPEGWTKGDDLLAQVDALRAEEGPDIQPIRLGATAPLWQCPEHKKTNWQCRYCVAQAVVEGEIEPMFVMYVDHPTGTSGMTEECAGGAVMKEIAEEDASNSNSVTLYVRVAKFTRKLSRD